MKIKFVLFTIALFAGCADSSFTRSTYNDIKIPKTGYRFGEITTYPPVSRVNSPGWMMRARKGNKWGYVDSLRGDILVPFVFDFADDLVNDGFSRQYARVLLNGKWGFINWTGETVLPFVYEDANEFHKIGKDNIARVRCDGKWIYIDDSNREIRHTVHFGSESVVNK